MVCCCCCTGTIAVVCLVVALIIWACIAYRKGCKCRQCERTTVMMTENTSNSSASCTVSNAVSSSSVSDVSTSAADLPSSSSSSSSLCVATAPMPSSTSGMRARSSFKDVFSTPRRQQIPSYSSLAEEENTAWVYSQGTKSPEAIAPMSKDEIDHL
eukprot:TRINITY_DN20_c2_g1_i1.p1 TRINITY_DN20_c2_g1~~TRINITY_DN20_c2_g1_i1.p1  ORF type:complete len:165 (-),score=48.99 TRINITY_DN20_c2_g1_i1:356-823(-)